MKNCLCRLTGWPVERAEKLLNRLQQPEYEPESLVNQTSGWPGDYEGRTFLALVMLSRCLGKKAPRYDKVLDVIWQHRNEKGYVGDVLTDGFSEQQLSGNSWVLRGMCEACDWNGEPRAARMVLDIVQGLLLPVGGSYAVYPREKAQRQTADDTGLTGKRDVFAFSDEDTEDAMELCTRITGKVGPWYVSTDVGCAFIMLDGATAAYACLKKHMPQEKETIAALAILIREMCATFRQLEFIRMAVQTHATLSGLRGMVRFARLERDEELLRAAENIFTLYQQEGMTENYENYNWFTRPVHTEPCGHIDSFILAFWFWEITGKEDYVVLANRILYNAVLASQRHNGGFGLDTCLGAGNVTRLHPPEKGICEAHWCCTMRGGEFFEKLWDFAARRDKDCLYLPFLCSAMVEDADFRLTVETTYPSQTKVTVRVEKNEGLRWLRLYVPATAADIRIVTAAGFCPGVRENSFVTVPLEPGAGEVMLEFTLPVTREPVTNRNSLRAVRRVRGDVILGSRVGQPELQPFYDSYMQYGEAAAGFVWDVLEPVERSQPAT